LDNGDKELKEKSTTWISANSVKAAVWYGGKDVRIEDLPEPRIDKNGILVRVKSSGICGSDLHAFEGKSKRRVPPLVMGHEFAGIVSDIGTDVQDFQCGDRVVVEPRISCGKCAPCQSGRSNICLGLKFVGLHTSGAFAEYVAVPAEVCYKLPDYISFDEASLVEPLSVATHSVNVTPTKMGDSLLVIGAGVVGLLIMMVARNRVGGDVFVTDLIDFKLDLAKKLSAKAVVHSGREDPLKRVRELTRGEGVDAVIEAVGIQDTLNLALAVVKKGGNITVTGLQVQDIQVDIMKLVTNEITLRGVYLYARGDFETSLELITNGVVQLKPLITHTFPLTEIAKAVDVLTSAAEDHLKVILNP
jgi:L-iditol 2-dehydrogenase